MKRTNYYLKLMGSALLFQSLALQTMASQFSTSEGIGKILTRMEQMSNLAMTLRYQIKKSMTWQI
ncbi:MULTISPECIES: hypothetical protein [Sphingobacterium]|uniref:hypothetical protein n=1 Tax=Sphingobacterium TaxID=28453 RepID=UPI00257C9BD9|nr:MULTISPECIES: hypothetical protein [Sphingobacterium]